jgi:hypothetical protein
MEIDKKYFTRKETIALVAVCFVLYGIGQYYALPSLLAQLRSPAPSSNVLPPVHTASVVRPAEKFIANAFNGKILSINTENADTSIELSLPSNGAGAIQESVVVKVTQGTKITKNILKPQSEIDALMAKYTADVKKDPKTPLPVITASVKTLLISELKVGNSITVYPLESIIGKTVSEIKEPTAQFILQN